jgi:hypothetical protein
LLRWAALVFVEDLGAKKADLLPDWPGFPFFLSLFFPLLIKDIALSFLGITAS